VEEDVLERIKLVNGFIGTGDSLVSNDQAYDNIVKNQLGNVLIVKDIDTLNLVGKIISYRYKIVSLDGEVLNTGGSITGGKNKANNGLASLRNELMITKNLLAEKEQNITNIEKEIKEANEKIAMVDEQSLNINKELMILEEKLNTKQNSLHNEEKLYQQKQNEISGTNNVINKSLDKEIENILKTYYDKVKDKDLSEKELISNKKLKANLTSQIEEEEHSFKEFNTEYNKYQNNLKDIEVN
jgi:chromosome segregation protein